MIAFLEQFVSNYLGLNTINIARLYKADLSIREIARKTFRNQSTISREIRRDGQLNQPSITSMRARIKPYRYTHTRAQKTRDVRFIHPKSLHRFNSFICYANNIIDGFTSLEAIYWTFQKKFPDSYSPCLKTTTTGLIKGLSISIGIKNPLIHQNKSLTRNRLMVEIVYIKERLILR